MQKELFSDLRTKDILPNEPAIGVLDKAAFTLVHYYDSLEDLLTLDKAKEFKEQEKAEISEKVLAFLRIKNQVGLSDERIKEICMNTKTLTLTKLELKKAVDDCIEDYNTPSELMKKIQEELEKYGHSLNTYNGIRIYKK